MVHASSNSRTKLKRDKTGVASSSSTSSDDADSEAITVAQTGIPRKKSKASTGVKSLSWEMTAEQALRVNFVDFEI